PRQERVGENAGDENEVELLRVGPGALEKPLRRKCPEVLRQVVRRGEATLLDAVIKGAVLAEQILGDRNHPFRHEARDVDDLCAGHASPLRLAHAARSSSGSAFSPRKPKDSIQSARPARRISLNIFRIAANAICPSMRASCAPGQKWGP